MKINKDLQKVRQHPQVVELQGRYQSLIKNIHNLGIQIRREEEKQNNHWAIDALEKQLLSLTSQANLLRTQIQNLEVRLLQGKAA